MTITVQTDTPLLQGGAAKLFEARALRAWMLETQLREAQVKGLLHTFARALFLPLLGGDERMAKHAERLLLGAPAGTTWKNNGRDEEYGKVLSIETNGGAAVQSPSYPNRPGGNKGFRPGVPPSTTYTVTLRLLPWVPEPEAHLKALWAILWVGLSFGGIGVRSRRGYGGLRAIGCKVPSLAGEVAWWESLPLFLQEPEDAQALAKQLNAGFATAQAWVKGWIEARVHGVTLATSFPPGNDPFQIAQLSQIFIGNPRGAESAPWKEIMKVFLDASSEALNESPDDARSIFGSISPRLASPIWLRIFKTQSGYVPVVTLGSSKAFEENGTPKPIVCELLESLEANPIAELVKKAESKGATT